MVKTNLNLLEQNLNKKKELLDALETLCAKQAEVLDSCSVDAEVFDRYMDEQDCLVQQLECLNDEAEELYQGLAKEDFSDKAEAEVVIGRIKDLILQLSNKSCLLEEKEEANKQKLENYLQEERKTFGTGRRSSKVALDYYKSMNRSNVIPPQFMDQKK